MGVWQQAVQSPRARAVCFSLGLHLVVGAVLIGVDPWDRVPEQLADKVFIDLVTLPPADAVIAKPQPAAETQPPPVTRSIAKPRRMQTVPYDASVLAPNVQNQPRSGDLLVPADPASGASNAIGGVAPESQRALANLFCLHMDADERDVAGCPQTKSLPRHLQADSGESVWVPRQKLDEIYEGQLASAVSTNTLERLLTAQGAPPSLPFAMGPIDNTILMDRPSDAEMDARAIQEGRRPDWASAIENVHRK